MLDYKLIEALAMVVQEGGFEKAANMMHLTQSAVSQRVRLLEERIGKILLSRTSPPCATEAGQKLIKHYLQVRLLEDGLEEEISSPDASTPVRLSLGINADSLSSWFLPALGELLADGNYRRISPSEGEAPINVQRNLLMKLSEKQTAINETPALLPSQPDNPPPVRDRPASADEQQATVSEKSKTRSSSLPLT